MMMIDNMGKSSGLELLEAGEIRVADPRETENEFMASPTAEQQVAFNVIEGGSGRSRWTPFDMRETVERLVEVVNFRFARAHWKVN